jgi:hypothetical protein
MNVHLTLPHLYIKFQGQIHLTLVVTKKEKNLTNSNSPNHQNLAFL